MKKKIISAVAVLVLGLTACGGKADPVVTSVEVNPANVSYMVGDDFVKPSVLATYSDGAVIDLKDSENVSYTGYNMAAPGDYYVKVTLEDVKTYVETYKITVKDYDPTLTGIEATYFGGDLAYGSFFDEKDVMVVATYSDGREEVVHDFEFENEVDTTSVGDQEVVVSYLGEEAAFTVKVLELPIPSYDKPLEDAAILTIQHFGIEDPQVGVHYFFEPDEESGDSILVIFPWETTDLENPDLQAIWTEACDFYFGDLFMLAYSGAEGAFVDDGTPYYYGLYATGDQQVYIEPIVYVYEGEVYVQTVYFFSEVDTTWPTEAINELSDSMADSEITSYAPAYVGGYAYEYTDQFVADYGIIALYIYTNDTNPDLVYAAQCSAAGWYFCNYPGVQATYRCVSPDGVLMVEFQYLPEYGYLFVCVGLYDGAFSTFAEIEADVEMLREDFGVTGTVPAIPGSGRMVASYDTYDYLYYLFGYINYLPFYICDFSFEDKLNEYAYALEENGYIYLGEDAGYFGGSWIMETVGLEAETTIPAFLFNDPLTGTNIELFSAYLGDQYLLFAYVYSFDIDYLWNEQKAAALVEAVAGEDSETVIPEIVGASFFYYDLENNGFQVATEGDSITVLYTFVANLYVKYGWSMLGAFYANSDGTPADIYDLVLTSPSGDVALRFDYTQGDEYFVVYVELPFEQYVNNMLQDELPGYEGTLPMFDYLLSYVINDSMNVVFFDVDLDLTNILDFCYYYALQLQDAGWGLLPGYNIYEGTYTFVSPDGAISASIGCNPNADYFYVILETFYETWPTDVVNGFRPDGIEEEIPHYTGPTTQVVPFNDAYGTGVVCYVEEGTEEQAMTWYGEILEVCDWTLEEEFDESYYGVYTSPEGTITAYVSCLDAGTFTVEFEFHPVIDAGQFEADLRQYLAENGFVDTGVDAFLAAIAGYEFEYEIEYYDYYSCYLLTITFTTGEVDAELYAALLAFSESLGLEEYDVGVWLDFDTYAEVDLYDYQESYNGDYVINIWGPEQY